MQIFGKFFKASILTIACFTARNEANAQLSLGLKGGINWSNLNVKEDGGTSFDSRVAPNFAVLFNYQLGPSFSIQAEPGFSGRGAKMEAEIKTDLIQQIPYRIVSHGTLKLSYFELPLLAQYRPHLSEKLEAIISAGPELRFRTAPVKVKSTTTTYVNGVVSESVTNTESNDDAVEKLDVGMAFGAGAAYSISKFKVFAEARYHLGLRNITASNPDAVTKIYNRGASVVLGVTVPLLNR
ncbi:PorT family protein [Dyadobacter sp. CY261]|uniref:porin family protein n=1 Tax=Dyadobacter sp. CY261 TaxID=2907203 RepID=UPI001F15BFB8|nr:porin family protein [Dyadobacter sp. CY261]MCF0074106.1 PorT family protein [Dyadobacter sp. CY261]